MAGPLLVLSCVISVDMMLMLRSHLVQLVKMLRLKEVAEDTQVHAVDRQGSWFKYSGC